MSTLYLYVCLFLFKIQIQAQQRDHAHMLEQLQWDYDEQLAKLISVRFYSIIF